MHPQHDVLDVLEGSTAGTSEVRSMLRRRAKKEIEGRPKSSLGSVKTEEFYGDWSRNGNVLLDLLPRLLAAWP